MKQYLLLLTILLLYRPASILAQQTFFQQYSVNTGLPHGQVHKVYQTSDGYMWVGTYGGGLSKFNGEDFTTYTKKDGLKDNSVEIIFEDSEETLWVATYESGIAKMEGNQFVYPLEGTSLDTADVFGIGELSTGELWIATLESGLYLYDGSTLKRYTMNDGLVSNTIWDVWEDESVAFGLPLMVDSLYLTGPALRIIQ